MPSFEPFLQVTRLQGEAGSLQTSGLTDVGRTIEHTDEPCVQTGVFLSEMGRRLYALTRIKESYLNKCIETIRDNEEDAMDGVEEVARELSSDILLLSALIDCECLARFAINHAEYDYEIGYGYEILVVRIREDTDGYEEEQDNPRLQPSAIH